MKVLQPKIAYNGVSTTEFSPIFPSACLSISAPLVRSFARVMSGSSRRAGSLNLRRSCMILNLCSIIAGALRASKLVLVSLRAGYRARDSTYSMPDIIFSNSSHQGAGLSLVLTRAMRESFLEDAGPGELEVPLIPALSMMAFWNSSSESNFGEEAAIAMKWVKYISRARK